MSESQTSRRWYDQDPLLAEVLDLLRAYPADQDPVVFRAVELLRVVPPAVQRQAAERFLEAMKKQGLTPELLKSNPSS
jgi:hypothetical protein